MNVLLLLMSIPCMFFGPLVLFLGYRSRKLARAAASWPHVIGTVTSSRVVIARMHAGDVRDTKAYKPEVVYTYEVDGRAYEGRRFDFGGRTFPHPDEVRPLLTPYLQGSAVPVFYKPADPRFATLDTRMSSSRMVWIIGWCMCALGCAGLAFFGTVLVLFVRS